MNSPSPYILLDEIHWFFFFFFKLVFYIIIIISIFGRISGSVSYHIYLTKWTNQQLKCGCFGAVELGSRGWNGRVGIVMEWRVGVWWLADWHNVLVWEWWRSPQLQKERREKGVGLYRAWIEVRSEKWEVRRFDLRWYVYYKTTMSILWVKGVGVGGGWWGVEAAADGPVQLKHACQSLGPPLHHLFFRFHHNQTTSAPNFPTLPFSPPTPPPLSTLTCSSSITQSLSTTFPSS